MQKFIENLEEAEKINYAIDHILNVTFQVVNDKKMLINVVVELKKSLTKTINAILQYDYINKKVTLSTNPKENFAVFIKRSAPHYKISEDEILGIKEIFQLVQTHNEATMEFTRSDKVVILAPNMEQKTISIDQAKRYLRLAKQIHSKAKNCMVKAE